jgi:hypothetical protein
MEDWVAAGASGSTGWTSSNSSGTTFVTSAGVDATSWGVIAMASGAANGNNASLNAGVQRLILGTGTVKIQMKVKLSSLSNPATNTYLIRLGLTDNGAGFPSNGVYFEYDGAAGDANWRRGLANGGLRTSANSSVAPVANVWTLLEIEIGTSSAEYFVDGVSIGTESTHFPTASCGPSLAIVKGSTGSTAATMWVDFYTLFGSFPSNR